jgi:hypothetical protein
MMTWLEMVAHYKGYQNLLQESEPFRIAPRPRSRRDSLLPPGAAGIGAPHGPVGANVAGTLPRPGLSAVLAGSPGRTER